MKHIVVLDIWIVLFLRRRQVNKVLPISLLAISSVSFSFVSQFFPSIVVAWKPLGTVTGTAHDKKIQPAVVAEDARPDFTRI